MKKNDIAANLPSAEERKRILDSMTTAERWEQLKRWYLPESETNEPQKGSKQNGEV